VRRSIQTLLQKSNFFRIGPILCPIQGKYFWERVTSSPTPRNHFHVRVASSPALVNIHISRCGDDVTRIFQVQLTMTPPLRIGFSRFGWWHQLLLEMVLWQKNLTFLYEFGWRQTLYQNCIAWRDLKLCTWQNFHLRLLSI
jgi:hypothetical protein